MSSSLCYTCIRRDPSFSAGRPACTVALASNLVQNQPVASCVFFQSDTGLVSIREPAGYLKGLELLAERERG